MPSSCHVSHDIIKQEKEIRNNGSASDLWADVLFFVSPKHKRKEREKGERNE